MQLQRVRADVLHWGHEGHLQVVDGLLEEEQRRSEGQEENSNNSSSSSVGASGDLGEGLQYGHCGISFHGSSSIRQEQTSSIHQSGDAAWLVHLAHLAMLAQPTLS